MIVGVESDTEKPGVSATSWVRRFNSPGTPLVNSARFSHAAVDVESRTISYCTEATGSGMVVPDWWEYWPPLKRYRSPACVCRAESNPSWNSVGRLMRFPPIGFFFVGGVAAVLALPNSPGGGGGVARVS